MEAWLSNHYRTIMLVSMLLELVGIYLIVIAEYAR